MESYPIINQLQEICSAPHQKMPPAPPFCQQLFHPGGGLTVEIISQHNTLTPVRSRFSSCLLHCAFSQIPILAPYILLGELLVNPRLALKVHKDLLVPLLTLLLRDTFALASENDSNQRLPMIVCAPTQNLQRAEALARICFRAPNVHAICTFELIRAWVSLHKVARHLIQAQSVLDQPTPPFCVQRPSWSILGQTPLVPSMKSATLGSPLFSTDMLTIGLPAQGF